MRTYRVRISRKAWRDVEELSDFLLTVISIEGARKYLDTMIAEVQSLALFADLYRPSTMADIRQYHPKARRMVSHNRRWVYIFHIEDEGTASGCSDSEAENRTVIVDRIRQAKLIKQ